MWAEFEEDGEMQKSCDWKNKNRKKYAWRKRDIERKNNYDGDKMKNKQIYAEGDR